MLGNAVVTGGAGFIGSHLVERLVSDGVNVTVIDNLSTGRLANLEPSLGPRLRFVEGDLAAMEGLTELFTGADAVFHLAALADIVPSIERPLDYHASNVDGTVRVLVAANEAKVPRLVYTASGSCYGLTTELPTSEGAAITPQYPYALTKWVGESYALHWAHVYGLGVVSLRLFNVYGPRSRTSGTYGAVFGVFLAQKLAGVPFTVVGDGTQSRDFVYVTDVADAFVRAAESNVSGTMINIGGGNPQSVNRLVELLGGDVVHVPKRPGEPDQTWANISRAKELIGWAPRVTFEEGVAKIVENIDYWREAPVWTPASIDVATREWHRRLGGAQQAT